MNGGMGQRIKYLRRLNKLTLEALAEKTDLSVSYLGLVEREQRTLSVGKLIEICAALHASLDYVVNGEEAGTRFRPEPVSFVDEDTSDTDMIRKNEIDIADFIEAIQSIVTPCHFDSGDYKILLNSLVGFVRIVQQMKINMSKEPT